MEADSPEEAVRKAQAAWDDGDEGERVYERVRQHVDDAETKFCYGGLAKAADERRFGAL